MMNCCGGFGGLMMLGMVVGTTLWVLLLAVVIWGLVRWLNGRVAPPSGSARMPADPSALEILQQRYARGEIDHATYEQMREHLQASMATSPPPWPAPR